MTRFISFVALLALASAPLSVYAQEEGTADPVAEASTEEVSTEEASAEAPTAEEEPAAAEEEASAPAEESAPEEASEEPAAEEDEVADTPEEADASEESADDGEEAAEEEVVEEGEAIDWGGAVERFPAFFAVMHRAAVHMPIALWMLGAVFVLVGVVVPSWRNQIPLACLIGGAMCALPAAASGWWNAEHEYGDEWAFSDLTDAERFSEAIVQHRWMAVALVIGSIILSVIALVNQRKKSKALGFVWRVGLLVLAAAVAWEGHIGGEMTVGDGFFEEALNEWLGVDWFTSE